MQATLVAANGRQAGTAIPIRVPEFAIGSHDSCQLRLRGPSFPDCLCKLQLGKAELWLVNEDRGDLVKWNDQPIIGRQQLSHGDRLQIGPLTFDIRLDGVQSPQPRSRPRVISDDEILTWLGDGDDVQNAGVADSAGSSSVSIPRQ